MNFDMLNNILVMYKVFYIFFFISFFSTGCIAEFSFNDFNLWTVVKVSAIGSMYSALIVTTVLLIM